LLRSRSIVFPSWRAVKRWISCPERH
jgi:hypothetical protein